MGEERKLKTEGQVMVGFLVAGKKRSMKRGEDMGKIGDLTANNTISEIIVIWYLSIRNVHEPENMVQFVLCDVPMSRTIDLYNHICVDKLAPFAPVLELSRS